MTTNGYFWSPRVPPRAVGISAVAFAIPVLAQLLLRDLAAEYELLLWLLALVPAFLLAYYKGWRGAAQALALGMVALSLSQADSGGLGEFVQRHADVGLPAVAAWIAVALGIGWLSELLHRQRILAEKNALDLITLLNEHGTIVYESPAVERMLGYKPEELVGRPASEFVHPEDAPDAAALLGPAPASPDETAAAEFRFRHKDGSWRILQAQGRNLLHDPRIGGVLVSSREITERRELEAQLRQAQKMEAIGRLAGGVAHDFNNLLMAVDGMAALLLDSLGEQDPRREDVQEIRKTVARGNALTRQLLAFGRKQVLKPRMLDLNGVVSDLEKMLRRVLGGDVALSAVLGPGLGRVYADPTQLEQVILNLAINARDAMPQGGRLVLSTRGVELRGESPPLGLAPGRYAVLTVSDTGTGMDAETAQQIFEPFFTTKEPGKGTGLGLATVYGIVKQSGGAIEVQSEPGKGATFSVYLPQPEEPAPRPVAPLEPVAVG